MTIVKATGTDQIDENSLKNTYRIMYFMDASASYISFDVNWIRIQFKATGRDAFGFRIIYGDTIGNWLEYALKSDLSEKLSIYSMYKSENAPFSLQLSAGQYLVFVYSMNYSAPVNVKMFLVGGGDYNDGIDHYKAVQIFSNSESITLSGTVSSDNSKMLTLTASGQPNMFIKAIKIG